MQWPTPSARKAYEYGWHVGHADTMCALGEIDIEEIDKETQA